MHNNKKKWITYSFSEALEKIAKKRKDIILLDADLGDDANLRSFEKKYPAQFIQNGIAEQDMVSMAGGIALMGLLPVVNSFASFLIARANEQIYNNATENKKIIYICLYSGLIPAGAGKSHQSLRDISLLSAIPNIRIFHPYDYKEVKEILKYCVYQEKESSAIRLNLGPSPKDSLDLPKNYEFKIGRGTTIKEGKDGVIFSYGSIMLNQSIKTREILKNKNLRLKIINMPNINTFDKLWLKNILKYQKNLFFIEDHSTVGGLADLMMSSLIEMNLIKNFRIKKFGIKEFPNCGTVDEVLKSHNLDEYSLSRNILNFIKNKK